jgi:hypothetical protein
MSNIAEINQYLNRFTEIHAPFLGAYIHCDILCIYYKSEYMDSKTEHLMTPDTLHIENVQKYLKEYCDYVIRDQIVGLCYLIDKTIVKIGRNENSIEFELSNGDTLFIESFNEFSNIELNILEVNGDIETIIGTPIEIAFNHKNDDSIELFRDFTIETEKGSVNIKLDATEYDGSCEWAARLCLRKTVKKPDWNF